MMHAESVLLATYVQSESVELLEESDWVYSLVIVMSLE